VDPPRNQAANRENKPQSTYLEKPVYSTQISKKHKEENAMDEPTILDKAFHVIMKHMVETGQAPFYTELASSLGLAVEEGRKTLHDLFNSGIAGWLYPRTDHIVSFAFFNNLPTHYRITIDGRQKWFGQ
jgi:hypothetical protein